MNPVTDSLADNSLKCIDTKTSETRPYKQSTFYTKTIFDQQSSLIRQSKLGGGVGGCESFDNRIRFFTMPYSLTY